MVGWYDFQKGAVLEALEELLRAVLCTHLSQICVRGSFSGDEGP